MKKALLIGNGFTSHLINAYGNQAMMKEFSNRASDVIKKTESCFEMFRNLAIPDSELYNVHEALYPNKTLTPSKKLFPSKDGIVVRQKGRDWIMSKLKALNYTNPEEIFDSYFVNYGLIYSINREKLVGVETYLKTIALFEEIGEFTKEEYNYLKDIATQTYSNYGNHGIKSIDNINVSIQKLNNVILDIDDVYTTNYDTILDDILNDVGKYPYHLHGGFSINHKNKDPDGRYEPCDATLIWGANAEEKFEELSPGIDFGDFNFSAVRFGQSRLADYYDYLENNEYDEFHILGFSGENDDHINSRIINNKSIKKVICYVNPRKLDDKETMVRARLLFGRGKKVVELRGWTEFWSLVYK